MHDIDRTLLELERDEEYNGGNLELTEEIDTSERESPFNEEEEIDLATELLSISNEEELDQFLGNLFKKVVQGIKKGGEFIKKIGRPMLNVLKPLAKKALPFVGGAVGSMIPIPGVGTAVGKALGTALSNALEMELEGIDSEDKEFEMARKFVKIAGTAIKNAANQPLSNNPYATVKSSVISAIKEHIPSFNINIGSNLKRSGKWIRRGNKIIVLDV